MSEGQGKAEVGSIGAMDKLVVLMAALVTKDAPNMMEKIRTLAPLGLDIPEMAKVCNTTEATVRARLADLKKGRKAGA